MAIDWKDYQEEAASFFRSIGLTASTDVAVRGVRTSHNIDVLVKSVHAGFEVIWIIECKHWKTPVSKLHVLALREIVSDIGADRGILLSEEGFQSGALEAATLTNVRATSLAQLTASAANEIYVMRLHEIFNRIEVCNERYWGIPKRQRIEFGFRADIGEIGYSGARVIELVRDLLSKAFRGRYPFQSDVFAELVKPGLPKQFSSAQEIFTVVEPIVNELEQKLEVYETTRRNT